jgi:predicted HTH transcriptional regulator
MELFLSELNQYCENNRLEAKRALGGLPKNLWETYSAFANTNGGVILLGVEELSDRNLKPVRLPDPEKILREFWSIINDPAKVSANILTDKDVSIVENENYRIIQINVPRANRHNKPVYIGPNPDSGTYRRNGEGDYHCTKLEVRNMFRDAADETADTFVLENMSPDVLDYETVGRYRNRFRSDKPNHVWVNLPEAVFQISITFGNSRNGMRRYSKKSLIRKELFLGCRSLNFLT